MNISQSSNLENNNNNLHCKTVLGFVPRG